MSTWQHWVNFLAGIWIVVSAFMPFSLTGMATNLVVTGIIVAILSLWGAVQIESARSHTTRHA